MTEGTGDRWEDRENMKAASKAINEMTAKERKISLKKITAGSVWHSLPW